MLKHYTDERKDKPFLQGLFRYINTKKKGVPLSITLKKEEGKRAFFSVSFLDEQGNRMMFKDQDIIQYQYAWGIPKAYASLEDLESPLPGVEINEKAYNQAEVVANHGLVNELVLELRFERGKGKIFGKAPFYQMASLLSDLPHWSRSIAMPRTEEEDHEMWYQTYRLKKRDFQGRIRVMWRSSSRD